MGQQLLRCGRFGRNLLVMFRWLRIPNFQLPWHKQEWSVTLTKVCEVVKVRRIYYLPKTTKEKRLSVWLICSSTNAASRPTKTIQKIKYAINWRLKEISFLPSSGNSICINFFGLSSAGIPIDVVSEISTPGFWILIRTNGDNSGSGKKLLFSRRKAWN